MLAGGSVISWREQLRSDQLASLPSILPPSRQALSFYGGLLKLGISSVFWSFHQLAGVKFLPKAKDFEKLASLPSIHSSSFPPCSVLLWKLAETWDRFCLDSFDPFISSLVKNFYQKPKSLSRWRHFSSIQPFSLSPSILYPPCTVFSNQSEWLIPRHNYTRLFVKFIATLCSTKIASPPFLFSCHTLSFSTNTRIGNLPQLETSSILDLTIFGY